MDLYHASTGEFQHVDSPRNGDDNQALLGEAGHPKNQRPRRRLSEKYREKPFLEIFTQLIDIPCHDDIICLPAAKQPSGE